MFHDSSLFVVPNTEAEAVDGGRDNLLGDAVHTTIIHWLHKTCIINSHKNISTALRQIRRIRCSLDDDSIATLVHAFVASRVDYCVGLLAGAPKKTTDKLQCVLNAAVRVVSNRGKYDRGLTQFRRHTLHWLDVADRIRFRLCVQVYKCHKCQHRWLPDIWPSSAYLSPTSTVTGICDLLAVAI